jgi:SAM-dependent methyltransferase
MVEFTNRLDGGAGPPPLRGRLRDLAAQVVYLRRTGLNTGQLVDLAALGIEDPENHYYEATEWSTLRRVLPRDRVTGDDVFLDIGCGMGRVLLLASLYRFRRVIGVDLAPELIEVARRNIARVRGDHVEAVVADVTTWPVPDDVTVVSMSNPFSGTVFSAALEQITSSLERRPRRLRLVYRNPVEHELVMRSGWARVAGRTLSGPRGRAGADVVSYALAPPAAA